jgi:glycosyltransferase involved in cell wall biosynthesis
MNRHPIRVLFLQSTLRVGGSGRQVADLVSSLERAKFEPIICCVREAREYGEELRAAGFKVYSDLLAFGYDIRAIYRISEIISQEKIDILVNSGTNRTFVIGYLAALSARLKKIVAAIHSTTPASGGNLTGALTRWVLRRASRIVMVAHAQKRTLCAREGINPAKVTVIHNGVSLSRLNLGEPLTHAQVGIPVHGPRVVGIVARLEPEKDHRTFLRAARLISGVLSDVFFLVVGDGPERSRLERLTQEWGIADRVRFLGNVNPVARVLPLLDVGVLSSYIEGFPVSVQEIMAAKKPVVVTDVGGLGEMIDDEVEGFIVPPRDADSLAQRIRILLEDKERASLMGARGRERVEREWTAERMAREFEQLFCEVLDL